jgi:hypothetical protein
VRKEKKGPSRSFWPGRNAIDSPLGFLYNADGNA